MNIFLVAICFILLFVYLFKQVRKPPNFPPGPLWLPFVGNLLYLKKLTKSLGGLHKALAYLSKHNNTNLLGLKLGKEYIVSVSDYQLIREVLIRDEFEGRPDNYFLKLRSFGRKRSGIVGSDGMIWAVNRRFLVQHFASLGFGKKPTDFMIKNEVDQFLKVLQKDGSSVSVAKFFAPKVLNILWTLVSGKPLSKNVTILDELLDLLNERGKAFDITGGVLNLYPWMRYIAPNWTKFNLIQEINGKLKNMIMNAINEHYQTWEEDREDDLIYSYISKINKEKNHSIFCVDELVIICLDIFIAGSTTTSGTLDLLLYMMIQHPEIQQKVQEEIDNVIVKGAVLEYFDLQKLPYTSAVLMEIHRYSHVIPIAGPRRAMKDTSLGGRFIPKNTTLLIDFHSVHHNKQTWGDPEVFKPERFLHKSEDLETAEKIAPFGLGKRRCPGEVLAKQCLFFFFVEILRNFKVTIFDTNPENNTMSLGITVTRNYKAKFIPR